MADQPGWEYRDMTIPLRLRSTDRDLEQRYYQIVLGHLRRAADEGWQPDEPIDLRSSSTAGRVRQHERGIRWTSWGQTTYESVTIRLKRRTP